MDNLNLLAGGGSLFNIKLSATQQSLIKSEQLPQGVDRVSVTELAKGMGKGEIWTRPSTSVSAQRASIELSTAEGDRVTLSYERTEASTMYIRPIGGYVPGLPLEPISKESFSMEIQGDLNGQELSDIEAFQEAVYETLEGFLSRQITDSETPDILDMSAFDSLTEYAVALDAVTSTSYASEMVKGYESPEYDPVNRASEEDSDFIPPAEKFTPPSSEPEAPEAESEFTRLDPGTKIAEETGRDPRLSRLKDVTDTVFEQVAQAAPPPCPAGCP